MRAVEINPPNVYTSRISIVEGKKMKKTKVFQSGNSQAVRLPKEMRFDADEVEIFKRGDEVVIRAIPKNLGTAFELLSNAPKDYMKGKRIDAKPQKRKF